jgi:hypothetical protein
MASSQLGNVDDLTVPESIVLLHRLSTESTKVQLMFTSSSGVLFTAQGTLKSLEGGQFGVAREDGSSSLQFNPSLAVTRKFGDSRALRLTTFPRLVKPGELTLTSALLFAFSDGSKLAFWIGR